MSNAKELAILNGSSTKIESHPFVFIRKTVLVLVEHKHGLPAIHCTVITNIYCMEMSESWDWDNRSQAVIHALADESFKPDWNVVDPSVATTGLYGLAPDHPEAPPQPFDARNGPRPNWSSTACWDVFISAQA